MPHSIRRRQFLKSSAAGAAATLAVPYVISAAKTDAKTIVGEGEFRYEVDHAWPKLPDRYTWQTTHNVAVDAANQLYVIHEGRADLKDHPSIFVFDADGRFVRAFGEQFQGGGHGIEVRQEGSNEFLYVCAYQQVKSFAKLTLQGETVWQKYAPMESGVYAEGEDTNPQKVWGRNRFMPTNFAFLPNGEFLLADGYGSHYIHHYDADANWIRSFGGPGQGEGTFNTPHGIWIDHRGKEPQIVVCDRAHHTLQTFDLNGKYLRTVSGFGLPANADTFDDLLLIPELFARVSLLDQEYNVVAQLGDDSERIRSDAKKQIRSNPESWKDGRFVHPHDACFDREGNIFVAEWVGTGRVSRLRKRAAG